MKNRRLVSRKQNLDALFKRADALSKLDDSGEVVAHWARYLCILASGFIEESVRVLVKEYLQKRSTPEVAKFAGARVQTFSNAKMEKIMDLIGDFGPAHRSKLEDLVTDELRDCVNSVVGNRHQIAHGRDVGISLTTIKGYYVNVVRAVEALEAMLDEGVREL